MKQIVTRGIVLARTDYGEADRILTILTPDHGKIRVMAKGVRKVKSKLAGGIELFSVSHITFIPGRKDISTLVSTRLETHYGAIIHDIDRTMLGYELLKRVHKVTEDEPGSEYFELLQTGLSALNDDNTPLQLTEAWFDARLLTLAGQQPNLQTDHQQKPLLADRSYTFDYGMMCFTAHPEGQFTAEYIKALRLLFQQSSPLKLLQVQGIENYVPRLYALTSSLRQQALPH